MADTHMRLDFTNNENSSDSDRASTLKKGSPSGVSQELNQLTIGRSDLDFESMEEIDHQHLGDRRLDDVSSDEENVLLGLQPRPTNPIVNKLSKEGPKASNKEYDAFIHWTMAQCPTKKRKMISERYEKFMTGEGKNTVLNLIPRPT